MEKNEDHFYSIVNTLCILFQALTVGYFIDIEYRQIDIDKAAYMENGWNIVDNLYIGATCLQVAIRMVQPGTNFVPSLDANEDHNLGQFLMIMLNFMVMIFSTLKVLSLLRMFKEVGNMVQLFLNCMDQIAYFLRFHILFILGTASVYKLLGADFNLA